LVKESCYSYLFKLKKTLLKPESLNKVLYFDLENQSLVPIETASFFCW